MVNTFLPSPDFRYCARVLDDKRLYKQIVECKQMLLAIEANNNGTKYGYQHHPIVKMWQRYSEALRLYQFTMLKEWTMRRYSFDIDANNINYYPKLPQWLGDEELHKSHRLNLLYKDYDHYSKYFSEEKPTTKPEYKWVV